MITTRDELRELRARELLMGNWGDGMNEEQARWHLQSTEHRGDCTNEPFTCIRCIADEARADAEATMKAEEEAGLAWTQQESVVQALTAAMHALRSYQYGNGSPELAESVADLCEKESAAISTGNLLKGE
jgi:glucose-6-phosphate 1-dehydrogenase